MSKSILPFGAKSRAPSCTLAPTFPKPPDVIEQPIHNPRVEKPTSPNVSLTTRVSADRSSPWQFNTLHTPNIGEDTNQTTIQAIIIQMVSGEPCNIDDLRKNFFLNPQLIKVPFHRNLAWKVLLDIVPRNPRIWKYVDSRRRRHFQKLELVMKTYLGADTDNVDVLEAMFRLEHPDAANENTNRTSFKWVVEIFYQLLDDNTKYDTVWIYWMSKRIITALYLIQITYAKYAPWNTGVSDAQSFKQWWSEDVFYLMASLLYKVDYLANLEMIMHTYISLFSRVLESFRIDDCFDTNEETQEEVYNEERDQDIYKAVPLNLVSCFLKFNEEFYKRFMKKVSMANRTCQETMSYIRLELDREMIDGSHEEEEGSEAHSMPGEFASSVSSRRRRNRKDTNASQTLEDTAGLADDLNHEGQDEPMTGQDFQERLTTHLWDSFNNAKEACAQLPEFSKVFESLDRHDH